MKHREYMKPLLLAASLAALWATSPLVNAGKKPRGRTVTLMQLQDVHGHIAPHQSILKDEVMDPNSGGVAKLATLIKQVRSEVGEGNSLLLAVGDTTHGSAEMLFTMGDAIMPMLNALHIDAFLPGNWDFGWGPRVYRQRFTPNTSIELAPNNRTTIAWMDGRPGHEGQNCNQPGGLKPYSECHVTKANFPTVAINLYNYNEEAGVITGQTHPGFIVKEANGVKVGIIGITSDVVPQQAQAFNTGFRFTMGYKELPVNIAAAKAAGAEMIVVLSELGLAKNTQLVKEFPEINVMFSGHTHERTPHAIVINRRDENGDNIGIVTEAGEDDFLGRLDVKVSGGRITSYDWDLMEANGSVVEDPAIKALVDQERLTFLDTLPNGDPNPDFQCHTFGVNAFPFGSGHTLCQSLDAVVGHTDPTIERFNVLEDISNNAMTDAFLDLAQYVDGSLNDGNSLSTTNGFRFDVTIFGSDDGFSGDITIGDLYTYYPIGAAVALAEFTGGRLKDHWEGILSNVFDPNPYRQRGGWFLGFTHNMHFDVELNDDFPRSISDGKRIDRVTIDAGDGFGPRDIDRSRIYTLASCYPHGNPTDEVCRTSGATNVRFIVGTQEDSGPTDIFGNRQLAVAGPFSVENPVVTDDQLPVFQPGRTPLFRKVAPNNFVHPIDALRRYLAVNDITTAAHGHGRVIGICNPGDNCKEVGPGSYAPISEYGGEGIVQPTQGAGPAWMKREFVQEANQNMQ
jgi:2',3'-cyclic-nucleotide 2'-phosphodiesterase (5'-nucleotidase family)